ncbi:MAG: FAD:protein transferase [Actinomycetota bacterium]|jgi:thiamine biosynthesis lipoprotein|nr:FAD:protein transferase [Actinomycetota bacterium]
MTVTGTATFSALGTTATVLVDDVMMLAEARRAVEREIRAIDAACSRFRPDSDLCRVNAAPGRMVPVSPVCIEAIDVAFAAAVASGGLVDPTVGNAMRVLGYDRDFASMTLDGPPLRVHVGSVPGWRVVEIDRGSGSVRVPTGVELDLGATAKALCADRSANAAAAATGAAVVVGLGGDIAIAGDAPEAGWLVRVADDHTAVDGGQMISVRSGGVATSGTTRRTWTRGGTRLHHLIDPRTGTSANGGWRTVSVAAGSCVDANVASTASIVIGADAVDWLAERRLPARLVTRSGKVTVVGGWPAPAAEEKIIGERAPC